MSTTFPEGWTSGVGRLPRTKSLNVSYFAGETEAVSDTVQSLGPIADPIRTRGRASSQGVDRVPLQEIYAETTVSLSWQ